MPHLHPITALLVAEQADSFEVIDTLLGTCKELHALLTHYETSIVKSWIPNNRRLIPPSWVILSSATHERTVLRPFRFDTIREFDLRQRRIDALFDDGSELLNTVDSIREFKILSADQRTGLILGLKRACAVADRLSDCLAHVQKLEQMIDERQLPTARRAHWEMRRYLESLSSVDLAYLFVLESTILPDTLDRVGFRVLEDDYLSTQVAIKEIFLRQGSLALQAWFLPLMDKNSRPVTTRNNTVTTTMTPPQSPRSAASLDIPTHSSGGRTPRPYILSALSSMTSNSPFLNPPSPSSVSSTSFITRTSSLFNNPPSLSSASSTPSITCTSPLVRHFHLLAEAMMDEMSRFELGGEAASDYEKEYEDDGRGVLKGLHACLGAEVRARIARDNSGEEWDHLEPGVDLEPDLGLDLDTLDTGRFVRVMVAAHLGCVVLG